MDPGPGKTVGIDLDQATGNMSVAWSADQSTLSWLVLIDDAANRVLAGTNISSKITNPLDLQVGPKGANYVEQIQWRNADTGKLLAASDFFSPMIVGMQVWAGYGGLIYEGLNEGNIMALKVLPATNATSISVNATINSTASATSPTSETTYLRALH